MDIIIRERSRLWVLLSFFTVVLLALVSYSLVVVTANAQSVANDWQWTNTPPTVAESSPVDDVANQYCAGVYESIKVADAGQKWMCTRQGQHVKVGMYSDSYNYRTLVNFANDTTMYPVRGVGSCDLHGGCLYIPETDTLVTKQNLLNVIVRSLVIYKNFTQRLTRYTDQDTSSTAYRFDASNPDFVFKSGEGYPWPVEGLGISDNGEWLAVEFRSRGFGILNMNTLEMKRFTTQMVGYGGGRDPTIELAITNDGNHVVLMGSNYGDVTLYDVSASCGDSASDKNMEFVIPVARPCKKLTVDSDTFITRFFAAYNPSFSDDGGELDFYAKSYTGGPRAVSLHAAGYESQRLDYLALGDSFTSGEGETSDSYYQQGTNDEFEKCHLSTRSYPYLIARLLGIEAQYVHSVACSGATAGDVIGSDRGYWGQNNRLGEKNLNLNKITKNTYQSSAKDNFNAGRIHQIGFVERYKPKVITIGIGGNDVGFMEKLRSCVGIDTCEWANSDEGREKTALEVRSAFDKLVSTYQALHLASPKSKIYVIGYPKIIDAQGTCGLIDGILLNSTERTFMNEGIVYINQVIAAAAQKAGIKYIDIQASFGNQVLCGGGLPTLMNAVRVGDDETLIGPDWLKVIGKESFHPRPDGHAKIAETIMQSIPDISTYSYCATELLQQSSICPVTTTAPWPSNYWLVGGQTHNYAQQHVTNFVKDSPDLSNIRQKTVALDSYTFAPNSSVTAEVRSDPITLGTAVADAVGGMSFDITLPSDLVEGFHTIHLYGTSYSGESIDLYQVIRYVLPRTDPATVLEPANANITTSPVDSTRVAVATSPVDSTQVVVATGQTESSQTDSKKEVAFRSSQSAPQTVSSVPSNDPRPVVRFKANNPSFDTVSSFVIPSASLLLAGAGFALYARLRRNR